MGACVGVGVRAILARFVVTTFARDVEPTRPQTVPGSRGVEVCDARDVCITW